MRSNSRKKSSPIPEIFPSNHYNWQRVPIECESLLLCSAASYSRHALFDFSPISYSPDGDEDQAHSNNAEIRNARVCHLLHLNQVTVNDSIKCRRKCSYLGRPCRRSKLLELVQQNFQCPMEYRLNHPLSQILRLRTETDVSVTAGV